MRISDWSSDVCSSDLLQQLGNEGRELAGGAAGVGLAPEDATEERLVLRLRHQRHTPVADRLDLERVELVGGEIGRASCRERVCQYVSISAVAGSLKNQYKLTDAEILRHHS